VLIKKFIQFIIFLFSVSVFSQDVTVSTTISNFNGFQISCNGENDGSITVTVSGGTPAYTYTWATLNGSGLVAGDKNQTGLAAGTYSLTVTDANSYTATVTYELTEPDALAITETITNVTTNGANDGAIDVTVTGGVPAYTYTWATSNGSGLVAGDEDQTGLAAGTYCNRC
jgi:hypothetical protein